MLSSNEYFVRCYISYNNYPNALYYRCDLINKETRKTWDETYYLGVSTLSVVECLFSWHIKIVHREEHRKTKHVFLSLFNELVDIKYSSGDDYVNI